MEEKLFPPTNRRVIFQLDDEDTGKWVSYIVTPATVTDTTKPLPTSEEKSESLQNSAFATTWLRSIALAIEPEAIIFKWFSWRAVVGESWIKKIFTLDQRNYYIWLVDIAKKFGVSDTIDGTPSVAMLEAVIVQFLLEKKHARKSLLIFSNAVKDGGDFLPLMIPELNYLVAPLLGRNQVFDREETPAVLDDLRGISKLWGTEEEETILIHPRFQTYKFLESMTSDSYDTRASMSSVLDGLDFLQRILNTLPRPVFPTNETIARAAVGERDSQLKIASAMSALEKSLVETLTQPYKLKARADDDCIAKKEAHLLRDLWVHVCGRGEFVNLSALLRPSSTHPLIASFNRDKNWATYCPQFLHYNNSSAQWIAEKVKTTPQLLLVPVIRLQLI